MGLFLLAPEMILMAFLLFREERHERAAEIELKPGTTSSRIEIKRRK